VKPTAVLGTQRPQTESRDRESVTRETLIRDAHRLLSACGVKRSPGWVSSTVRTYLHRVSGSGFPFGAYLMNSVELNAEQRAAALTHSELRYLLDYRDSTGEEAVGFVRPGASFRRGASR
jgi:hypothetical protein